MWDLPRSGFKPMSLALAGGFFTTEPPGKPFPLFFKNKLCLSAWAISIFLLNLLCQIIYIIIHKIQCLPWLPAPSHHYYHWSNIILGSRAHSSIGKESTCNTGDLSSIPGSGRSPGEGNGNPLHYSCRENPLDRGAWQATVHGVTRVGHNLATKPPEVKHYN